MRFFRVIACLGVVLLCACTTANDAAFRRPAPPVLGKFDPASVSDIDVLALPVLPEITEPMRANLRDAVARGRAKGKRPDVFSKLGDCMTENEHFFLPFGDGDYDLGAHAALQPLIERFRRTPARAGNWTKNSFDTPGLSAAGGFNIAAPLDPTWSNPEWCRNSESPLACELRVAQPAYALIMFGTNDVALTDGATYDYFLRSIVNSVLDAGVVPILSTFPYRPEDPEKTLLLNRIAVRVAADYQIPIMNLFRALEALPDRGVNTADTIHLSVAPDGRADVFDEAHLRYGFATRNLVTLQSLASVVQALD